MSGNNYNFAVQFGAQGSSLSHYIQDIDTSNKVDGKPIYYWVNHQDEQVPSDAGFVGVVNSTNVTVEDLTLTKNGAGVLFAYTEDSRIENVTASNNFNGIYLYSSSGNTLTNNTVTNNYYGIELWYSNNNTLTNNTVTNNFMPAISLSSSSSNTLTNNNANSNHLYGIYLDSSSNNTLTSNTANSNSWAGILLYSSSDNNTLTSNTANSNSYYGIELWYSSSNTLTNNNANSNNYYGIWLYSSSSDNNLMNNTANWNNNDGIHLSSSSNNTLTSNTASNNIDDGICVGSSSNNTLTSNTASNNTDGIYLDSSSNNNLTNNTLWNNDDGIYLYRSSNNTLTSNTALNNYYGIYLYFLSSGNTIYNNYFSNAVNARDNGANTWNTTNTTGPNIIGGPYLGGNYWSDYTGSDTNGDGFGDTPYNITGGSNKDYLPLILAPIDVMRNLPDVALVPNQIYPGDTFDVYVNFTAPVDDFNAIGLTDLAPAGWEVETDVNWCSPIASWTMSPYNKAEYAWSGPFSEGTNFSAMYKVTVPDDAEPGISQFPLDNCDLAWLEYWFELPGPHTSCVTGDYQAVVTVPGHILGETRDVNHNLLLDVAVTLYEDSSDLGSDTSSPDYNITVNETGEYWLSASKDGYFTLDTYNMLPKSETINFTTPELLAAGDTFDFEGDYGLVPRACNMSYVVRSVNLWLFVPIDGGGTIHPEWQLSGWKAMQSVHSWQFST